MVYYPIVAVSSMLFAGISELGRRRELKKSRRRHSKSLPEDSDYDVSDDEELAAYARRTMPLTHRGDVQFREGALLELDADRSSNYSLPLFQYDGCRSPGECSATRPQTWGRGYSSESCSSPDFDRGFGGSYFAQDASGRRQRTRSVASSGSYYDPYAHGNRTTRGNLRDPCAYGKDPRSRRQAHMNFDPDLDYNGFSDRGHQEGRFPYGAMVPFTAVPDQSEPGSYRPPAPQYQRFRSASNPRDDFRRAWGSRHRTYYKGDNIPLRRIHTLSKGHSCVVDAVQHHRLPGLTVMRKIQRSNPQGQTDEDLKMLRSRADIWKSLHHPHITTLLGTYEDDASFSYLLYPVCHGTLASLLATTGESDPHHVHRYTLQERSMKLGWLKKWFGCLSSALAYIHSHGVWHYNIKPENIIYQNGSVYLSDLGFPDLLSAQETNLMDDSAWTTFRYAAPEVITSITETHALEKIGARSDIFSLGCVFIEMLAIVQGNSIANLHLILELMSSTPELRSTSQSNAFIYSSAYDSICQYFTHGDMTYDTMFERAIKPMLSLEERRRPTAMEVSSLVQEYQPWEAVPCGCHDFETNSSAWEGS